MAYEVRTDVYEGPFDVLLRLITEQRVDLYEVRLSDIVDAFLVEMDQIERVDLESATEFLLIAAILVELKSRRLLPDRDGSISEEDLALLEERDYLLARLVECTTFSAAGRQLAELEKDASRSYPRLAGPDERFEGLAPDLLVGITPTISAGRPSGLWRSARCRWSTSSTCSSTRSPLPKSCSGSYPCCPGRRRSRSVSSPAKATTRIEVVVHFLGVLKLYKQGLVELDQVETFGELLVSWAGETGDEPDVMGGLVTSAYFGGNFADLSTADERARTGGRDHGSSDTGRA